MQATMWTILSALAVAMAVPANAEPARGGDEPGVRVDVGPGGVDVDVNVPKRPLAGKGRGPLFGRAAGTQGPWFKASEIKGMAVRNGLESDLGQIHELVIARRSGRVRYAVLSSGGLLGVGDKLIAVSWKALEIRQDETDPDAHYAFLDVSKERVEEAPGFDEGDWPDFARGKFAASVDAHFGVGTLKAAIETDRPIGAFRTSEILGLPVKNGDGDELGSVSDLAVDADTGAVRYVAMSFGGFLGIGNKLFAVPWQAMAFNHAKDDAADRWAVVGVSKEELKDREGFDDDDWPSLAEDRWLGPSRAASRPDESPER